MVDLQSAGFLCDLCDLVVSLVESRVLHFPCGRTIMLARFFIDRPVLAWVISIVIILLGAIAAGFLPIAEYPDITPPTVRVTASYPGANAQVVADTVAAPIEQQVVGVEGMLYMSSQSNNDGSYSLDVTFQLGTEVNMAQVLVQNRVAIAEPTLPDVVRAIGVTTKKRSPDILLGISLYSADNPENGRPYYDSLYGAITPPSTSSTPWPGPMALATGRAADS